MDTRTARSTAKTSSVSALYHHEQWGAFECMGCGELIEIPALAVLTGGQMPVRIKTNPENLLIWRELTDLDHQPCMAFSDSQMAQDARKYRKQIQRRRPIVIQARATA